MEFNLKKIFPKRRSVLFAWLFSYVILILLVAGVNSIAATHLANVVGARAFDDASRDLARARENIDSRIMSIQTLASLVGSNSNTVDLLKNPSSLDNALLCNQLMSALKSYESINSFIDGIYIFPDSRDVVISANYMLGAPYKERLLTQYALADGTPAAGIIEEPHYRDFVPMMRTVRSSESSYVVAMLQTLPGNTNTRRYGSLMIEINNNELLNTISTDNSLLGNYYYIIDSKNRVIASNTDAELPGELGYESLEGMDEDFELSLGGSDYMVFQVSSGVAPWKYIFLMPRQILTQGIDDMRRIAIISTVAAMFVGLAIAIYLVRRHYIPLRTLLASVDREAGVDYSDDQDEYSHIQQTLNATLAMRDKNIDNYRKQLIRMRYGLFTRMLKNDPELEMESGDMLAACDVKFVSDDFVVLLISVSGAYPEPSGSSGTSSPSGLSDSLGTSGLSGGDLAQKIRTARFVVKTIFEERIGEEHTGYVFGIDDMQAMIWNFAPGSHVYTASGDISRVVSECISYVKENCGVGLTVTVGGMCHSAEKLHESYKDAFEAMEYCIMMEHKGLHFSSEIQFADTGWNLYGNFYPLQSEIQLINYIKSGDYENAKRTLDMLFETNFGGRSMPATIVKCFMFNLACTFMKVYHEINLPDEVPNEEITGLLEKMLSCKSLKEIHEEANAIILSFCDITKNSDSSGYFLAETEAYVRKNFANLSLNVPMIADHLNLTASYLSKKYKNITGVGLLDHINQIRVEKAKEMLVSGNMSIADIAVSSGFINSNTLIRVFKKYEGITPGKFREVNG